MWQRLLPAVFWLLMLAIPVQGFAAAGMLFCGPGHHGDDAGAVALPAGHGDHAHPASVVTSQQGKLDFHKAGVDTCGACIACCSAAALPATVIATPVAAPHAGPLPAESSAFAGFIAGGLERPPRHLLG